MSKNAWIKKMWYIYKVLFSYKIWTNAICSNMDSPRYYISGQTQKDKHHIILFMCGISVQFSHSIMSNSLWPHGLQHARPPCPSPTPGVYSNSCLLSWWCHPTISSSVIPFPPAFSLCQYQVFSNESVLHIRWPKYWSFSFNISPFNEYSGLISFRMDWLDLLVVQGTLKSLLQHHSSKTSILCWSAFFIVQLSHPYMTTGKTITLTRWTFVGSCLGWS